MTNKILALLLLSLGVLITGCPTEFEKKREAREEQTGLSDMDVIEIDNDGKTYILVRWHSNQGSDMELVEVKDAEVHSDSHTEE